MTGAYISPALRQRISEQARHRCGYCLRGEELMGMALTIDHIIPQARGGGSMEDNLWLACPSCNQFKGARSHAPDPESGESVALFNPRIEVWSQHFAWSDDGARIIGLAPRGRATVAALRMNSPEIMVARRMWVSAGWWPPLD
jgi:5-methylcytosine-specific restriction endonuclease McrA